MRALVLRDFYDIAVEERPDPEPGPGQVIVEVIATGICGSDFHGYSGENGRRHPGQVMGHETVGRVHELGPDVEGLSVGVARIVDEIQEHAADVLRRVLGMPVRPATVVQPAACAGRRAGDPGGFR